MAYKTAELFEKSIKAIEENELYFIEDIVAYLPCHKSTFYEHFPVDSDNYKELVKLLETNRVKMNVSIRKKWKVSDNFNAQIALMRLTGNHEQTKRLSMNYVDHTTDGKPLDNKISIEIIKPDEE